MFWNVHESEPDTFNFEGNLDAATFVRTAHEEGLWVLLRPGPYSCAEWDFGGFPGRLLATPDLKVRSADPRFLEAAARYLRQVGKRRQSASPCPPAQPDRRFNNRWAFPDQMAAFAAGSSSFATPRRMKAEIGSRNGYALPNRNRSAPNSLISRRTS